MKNKQTIRIQNLDKNEKAQNIFNIKSKFKKLSDEDKTWVLNEMIYWSRQQLNNIQPEQEQIDMNEFLIENLKEQIKFLNQIILIKDQLIETVEQKNNNYKNHIVELEKIIESYKLLVDNSIYQLRNQ